MHRLLAGWNLFNDQIVDITVTSGRSVLALEGDVLSSAGIIVEIDSLLQPC